VVSTGGSGALASLFGAAKALDGLSWCDGGIVDIFPVRPVLDLEPAVDAAVAVNGLYPHEFSGEDITGWDARPLSRGARTLLVEPVPYRKVAGTGFYQQLLDTREWPEFMRAGRAAMLAALREHARRSAA